MARRAYSMFRGSEIQISPPCLEIKMETKNLEQVQDGSMNVDRAILQALLLTDGSVIPKRNQISFANTSETLLKQFCDLMSKIYGYKIKKRSFGKGTKQHLYIIQLKSKRICLDLLSDISGYRTTPFKDGAYPEIKIPNFWQGLSKINLTKILRALFDADGGCSLRISERKKRNCIEIERTLFLSCKHPGLRKQYIQLLANIGVKCGESPDKVVITGKENFEKFRDLINFSEGVLIGYDSRHWQGIEKRELLDIIINSYNHDYGFLQKFEKTQVYPLLRSPSR